MLWPVWVIDAVDVKRSVAVGAAARLGCLLRSAFAFACHVCVLSSFLTQSTITRALGHLPIMRLCHSKRIRRASSARERHKNWPPPWPAATVEARRGRESCCHQFCRKPIRRHRMDRSRRACTLRAPRGASLSNAKQHAQRLSAEVVFFPACFQPAWSVVDGSAGALRAMQRVRAVSPQSRHASKAHQEQRPWSRRRSRSWSRSRSRGRSR